jgi:hypothetical protein
METLRKLTSTTSKNTIANGWHNEWKIDLLNTNTMQIDPYLYCQNV